MSFGYNPVVEDPHNEQLPRKCYFFLPVRTRNALAAITLKTLRDKLNTIYDVYN